MGNEVGSALARSLTEAYRAYWVRSVSNPSEVGASEQQLARRVSSILGIAPSGDFSVLEPVIAARLRAEGLFSIQGKTGTRRDLMIWSAQLEADQAVDLPEGRASTRVIYLRDFVSFGWGAYLTCDRSGTGGWAKPEGLYVVTSRWKSLDDERFRVSFLAHESQHFEDYKSFPGLKGADLEYRAKLAEFSLADDSRDRLIDGFSANQGTDENDAHSFANRRVLIDLQQRLGLPSPESLKLVSIKQFQSAARNLLLEDSQRRRAAK